MKNKLDGIISLLLVVAVGVGVYFYFFADKPFEGNALDDSPAKAEVKSTQLKEYYIGNAYSIELNEENHDILNIMDDTKATYFNVKITGSDSENFYELWKISKSKFDEINANAPIKDAPALAMDLASKQFLDFFNTSYETIAPVNPDTTVYNSYVLDKNFKYCINNIEEEFKSMFDGDVDDYFLDRELTLTCEEVKFHKICSVNNAKGNNADVEEGEMFYLIGKAKVHATSKSVEETTTVKIKTLVSMTPVGGKTPTKVTYHLLELHE